MTPTMKIMKFGGSSVRDAAQIKKIVCIIAEACKNSSAVAIVVSAMEGTTNALIKMGETAAAGEKIYLDDFAAIKKQHLATAEELETTETVKKFEETFKELYDVLHGVFLVEELSTRTLDLIMSFGERLSSPLVAECLKKTIPQACSVDARSLIKTDNSFGGALINFEKTNALIATYFATKGECIPIITGFIASTEEGVTTTLGRGGSDFTAAVVGAAINADVIEIWTDVDGVMTADPRKVKQAFPIPEMTYDEMMELSHFGAKVVHPPTISPALQKGIPLHIKNSFNPAAVGTIIAKTAADGATIRGISSIDNASLLRLEGSGMVGVCGVATRLFGALAAKKINVIIISQCSSEHSICFAVAPHQSLEAKKAIEKEFALEMHARFVDEVVVESEVSIIAIVGENMCRTTGISGSFFAALGKNGINVAAIAQGSSELNITCVISRKDEAKALNVIHDAFFLSTSSTANLFLVGTGLIGKKLLDQINRHRQHLNDVYNINIRLVGIANSKKMTFDKNGIAVDCWEGALDASESEMEVGSFVDKMIEANLANSIFVDCTSSEEVAAIYTSVLEANIAISTPNKKANSGPFSLYASLKDIAKRKGVKFLYEANVCAALPLLSTISDMVRSGDTIRTVEGILSGTLSYIFNHFTGSATFADVVKQAQEKGYTEPDPRDDLNGMDVARKLLILARECGHELEPEDIEMEPLLSDESFAASDLKDFYATLDLAAEPLMKKKEAAEAEGKRLRYIASWNGSRATIALKAVDETHPCFQLSGTDNIVAITSNRYSNSPLVIKGAGAGAEVTAGEVLAEIIKIASL